MQSSHERPQDNFLQGIQQLLFGHPINIDIAQIPKRAPPGFQKNMNHCLCFRLPSQKTQHGSKTNASMGAGSTYQFSSSMDYVSDTEVEDSTAPSMCDEKDASSDADCK